MRWDLLYTLISFKNATCKGLLKWSSLLGNLFIQMFPVLDYWSFSLVIGETFCLNKLFYWKIFCPFLLNHTCKQVSKHEKQLESDTSETAGQFESAFWKHMEVLKIRRNFLYLVIGRAWLIVGHHCGCAKKQRQPIYFCCFEVRDLPLCRGELYQKGNIHEILTHAL